MPLEQRRDIVRDKAHARLVTQVFVHHHPQSVRRQIQRRRQAHEARILRAGIAGDDGEAGAANQRVIDRGRVVAAHVRPAADLVTQPDQARRGREGFVETDPCALPIAIFGERGGIGLDI